MIRRRILKFVARDLLVEVLAADAEYARALSLVTARRREYLGDVRRFHFRETRRLLALSLRGDCRTQTRGQIFRANSFTRGDDDGSLDHVCELTSISRVVVRLE